MTHPVFVANVKRLGFEPVKGNRRRFLRKRNLEKTQIVDVPPEEIGGDRKTERVRMLAFLANVRRPVGWGMRR